MVSWRATTLGRCCCWLVAILLVLGALPSLSAWAEPQSRLARRTRPSRTHRVHRVHRTHRVHRVKKAARAPRQPRMLTRVQPLESGPRQICEAWPPKPLPTVTDIYQLKLEYDCRNRTIGRQRGGLAGQDALQSMELSEQHDRKGIVKKDNQVEREQSVIENRQRELDSWRDTVLRRLQSSPPRSGAS